MRDQRCLCPELLLSCCSSEYETLLTQTSSNYEIIVSEMAAPIMESAYLLSECQYWRIL